MIPLQPDDGSLDPLPATAPVDGGWLHGAQAWITGKDGAGAASQQEFDDLAWATKIGTGTPDLDRRRRDLVINRPNIQLGTPPRGEGFIYVVMFSTGTVKVGCTTDPANRILTHYSKALAYGVTTYAYWVSPSHVNYRENEAELINFCSHVSWRSRNEYFHEVTYNRAVIYAHGLPFHTSDLGQEGGCQEVWV